MKKYHSTSLNALMLMVGKSVRLKWVNCVLAAVSWCHGFDDGIFLSYAFCLLTHLSRVEFPTSINWTSLFTCSGLLVVFFIVIQIVIEYSVSKQWKA